MKIFITSLLLSFILWGCSSTYTQFRENPDIYPGHYSVDKPNVFSGTSANLVYAYQLASGSTGSDGPGDPFEYLFGIPYVIVDLPLSLAADVIYLPISIPKQIKCGNLKSCENFKEMPNQRIKADEK